MKTRDIFSYSYGAIRLRKLRSGLTTLGIVIGIAAIVALMSYTQGFEVSMTNQFSESFSTDTLIVTTQSFGGVPGSGGVVEPSDFTLYLNDTEAIAEIEYVDSVTAVQSKQTTVTVGEITLSGLVTGIDYAIYASIYTNTFVAESGEIPVSPDNDSVVIGKSIHDPWANGTIYADVGDVITITYRGENHTFTVKGILEEIGSSMGGPSDTGIYIPIDTAVDMFETEEVSTIAVKLIDDSDATIDAATAAIEALFDGEAEVLTSTAILEAISGMLDTIELLLGGVAGISLLVAGIGIMNIMIVSLMERTREIGILKALGAKSRTVLSVFLAEAVMIGVLGGIFGSITGAIMALVMSGVFGGMSAAGDVGGGGFSSMFSSITPVVTIDLVAMAMFFGIVVSLVFALYPAWRASKLQPVDALRNE